MKPLGNHKIANTHLSVVIPVLNEESSLPELVDRLVQVATSHHLKMQVVFVDDGSSDGSWKVIEGLAAKHLGSKIEPAVELSVEGIRFRRNFGKAAALTAGFEACLGDFVVTMDADLQDDPSEIPHLLAEIEAGKDVVSGWKKVRHDPWHKVLPSRCFNAMVSWLTGVRLHDHNCGLKAYRRDVLHEIRIYGEMHRFIPVLAAARGWRIGEIPVAHHARKHGVSKYGFNRFVKGFLDLLTVYFLTGFRQRPQHLMGTLGLVSLAFGSVIMLWLTLSWGLSRIIPGWNDVHLHERAIFYYAILALLLGVQLISMGFLAELIIASHRPGVATYSVADRIGVPGNCDEPNRPNSTFEKPVSEEGSRRDENVH